MTRLRTMETGPARAGWGAAALALGLLLASGCATQQGEHEITSTGTAGVPETHAGGQAPELSPQEVPAQPLPANFIPSPQMSFTGPRSIEDSGASAPVLSLYRKAEQARKDGKLDHAESALSRALRIDPRNPFVWQALAGVHLAEHQYDLAENEAQRSTSLGRGNPYLEADNLHIIADVHDARGDAAGALQARSKAADLLSGAPPSQ